MRCQVCGRQWQKACTARSGAGFGSASQTNTTPEVPSDTNPCPGRTQPMPTAPAALSPAPPATGMPGGKPSSVAASARNRPETASPSTSRGMCRSFSPVASRSAGDHCRAATSSHSVPEASDGSETASPTRQRRSQSLGSSTRAVARNTSGS